LPGHEQGHHAGQSAVVIIGMGVDFYRYFLSLLVAGAICLGVGAGAVFGAFRSWCTRKSVAVAGMASSGLAATHLESEYNHARIGLSDDVPAQPSSAQ